MKKILWIAAAAVMTFGAVSCNDNESEPTIAGTGAFYPTGNYVRTSDGTKVTLPSGSVSTQGVDLDRYYFYFYGAVPEGIAFGPDATVPITTLYNYQYMPTALPIGKDEATHDDPVAGMALLEEGSRIDVGLNFLIIRPEVFIFIKNAEKSGEISQMNIDIEVDDLIVPGPTNDTINMRLKFFNNRAADESPYYNYTTGRYTLDDPIAFDLEDLTEFDPEKTYIVKLTYLSYEWDDTVTEEFDEMPVYTKFLTAEWTPGKPYKEAE